MRSVAIQFTHRVGESCIAESYAQTLESMYPARRTAMPQTIFNFFGLRENPFKINPDPRFLFITDQARATSDELAYAIRTRKGLILLTGEVGTGKTMLIRHLLNWLAEQKMPTALIFNSHIKAEHLLDFILNDFGIPCSSTLKSEKLIALNRWLLEQYRAGQIPVLIVDEAQGLDATALEEVRLLLNFETPREKLLQIVLAGQPELEIKLKRHELRQLRQRITVRCRTAPLTVEQTHGYIRERLRVAGANGNPIFEPEAVTSVHAYSHGIPRVINVLCEHSLVNACADGASMISPSSVEQAAHDCQLDRADSVARILKTGSYATKDLSDIDSMLAAISAGSDSPAEPRHTPPSRPLRDVDRLPQSASAQRAMVTRDTSEEQPRHDVRPAVGQVHQPVRNEPLEAARATATAVTPSRTVPARSQASSFTDTLRAWRRSFAADARATWRQLRRAIQKFEVRYWNPFVRDVQRELGQLRIRAVRLASDPRWKQMEARAVSASRNAYDRLRAALPPWLAEPLGISQKQNSHIRGQSAAASQASRRRTMMYLRRWLHEPLNSQRKRTHTSTRRF
jgi:general secretion pathway protein A